MAKVTPALVKQLRSMSSARPARCEAALKASKGDVDKALRALIASGDVTAEGLDPELTTKEHYALVALKQQEDQAVKLLDTMSSFLGADGIRNIKAEVKELRSHFTGKLRLDDGALSEGADARREALEARKGRRGGKGDAAATADPADPVARLARLSSLPPARCEAALRASRGNTDAALRSLIASGEVHRGDLDPDLATEEHYALVEVKNLLDFQQDMPPATRRALGISAAALDKYRKQLSGKAPVEKHFLRQGRSARERALGPRAPKRPKKRPSVLRMKPFPPLKDIGDWEGSDVLTSWAGFQARGGPYTSRSSSRPSNGKVEVHVAAPPGNDEDEDGDSPPPPSPEQVAAYRYLKDNQNKVRDAVIDAVFKEYPKIRKRYDFGEDDEQDDNYMPVIREKDELRRLIGPGIVHVLNEAKAGHAYVGFEMGCTWDEEHGLGVLTHKGRVVEVGQADTAFVGHSVKEDGGKPIEA